MAEIVGTVWEIKQETIMVRDNFNPGQKKQSAIRRIKLSDGQEYGCWDGSLDIQQGQSYRFLIESRNQPPSQRYPQGRVFNNIIGSRAMAASVGGAPAPVPTAPRHNPSDPFSPPFSPPGGPPPVEPMPDLPHDGAPPEGPGFLMVSGACPHCGNTLTVQVGLGK
jgi:hypothetical protein